MLSYWLVTLLAATQAATVLIPKPVVEFSVSHPAFVTLMPNNTVPNNPTWNILVSRFNGVPFSKDYISLVRDIGNPKSRDSSHVEDISDSLHWPNEPGSIPGMIVSMLPHVKKLLIGLIQISVCCDDTTCVPMTYLIS